MSRSGWLRTLKFSGSVSANAAFRAWWYAVAAYAFLGGFVLNTMAYVGWTPLQVYYGIRQTTIVLLVVGLVGLLHYVSFLWTGWERGRYLWRAVGGAIYLSIIFSFSGTAPSGVRIGLYDTRIQWSVPPQPELVTLSMALLIVAGLVFMFLHLLPGDPARLAAM